MTSGAVTTDNISLIVYAYLAQIDPTLTRANAFKAAAYNFTKAGYFPWIYTDYLNGFNGTSSYVTDRNSLGYNQPLPSPYVSMVATTKRAQAMIQGSQSPISIYGNSVTVPGLGGSGANFINFHWYPGPNPASPNDLSRIAEAIADYNANTSAMATAVEYLRMVTHLPVITTETGEFSIDGQPIPADPNNDVYPDYVTQVLQTQYDLGLPVAIFFDGDGTAAVALHNGINTTDAVWWATQQQWNELPILHAGETQ